MYIKDSCKASGPLLQVTALDLVRREDFPRLQDLLRGEFQPLSRLLLLLAWTQCQSLDSAHTLLSILHHNQVGPDPCPKSPSPIPQAPCLPESISQCPHAALPLWSDHFPMSMSYTLAGMSVLRPWPATLS